MTRLKGVGASGALRLARLGIRSVRDCLFHLPGRYIDRTRIRSISAVRGGEEALVQGVIELTRVNYYGKRRQLLCRVSDGTGVMLLRFFHFNRWQQARLVEGAKIRCWGKARQGGGAPEIAHPEYQILSADHDEPPEQTLTPIYPATEGVSQFKLRQITEQALQVLRQDRDSLPELIPPAILERHALGALGDALRFAHRPPAGADTAALLNGGHAAQRRLAFEELLAHQLGIRGRRETIKRKRARAVPIAAPTARQFLADLDFTPTAAQRRVSAEIAADMRRETPMLRLLQGDVGCGKTLVAAVAALAAIDAGLKALLMAPTEILADQHYDNFRAWFAPLGVPVYLLNARQSRGERKSALQALQAARPALVIGTHALFQEQVSVRRPGLIVIDEQHRFGVNQRLALLEKGGDFYPHQLIMTATPIPRTLAMTMFAELDISVIDESPPGRGAIKTTVLSNKKRPQLIQRIRDLCAAGRQVYWVCTLIEHSEAVESEAAEEIAATLADSLPRCRVALIHGRMKNVDKERIMRAFKAAEVDLLVATTVIEVGIDVPNAGLMVIENAERLGLAQLHQLRGRVGRGVHESNCVLLYQEPLAEIAQTRLKTMRETDDGFVIAQKDLQLRGPGELLGARQTGMPELKIADFARDAALLPAARDSADQILRDHPQAAARITQRWLDSDWGFAHV